MTIKRLMCNVSLFCLAYAGNASANLLPPQASVVVLSGGTYFTSPSVAATTSGFLIVCVENSDNLQDSFSTDGSTWNTTPGVFLNSYTAIWVTGTSAGFLASFIMPVPGYTTATPFSIFTSDNGTSWGSESLIFNSSTIATPVILSGTSSGFMATWNDTNDFNAYSSFSNNSGVSWSTPSQITNTGLVYHSGGHSHYGAVAVSGTSAGFMATWPQTDNNAYSSFSSNNGTDWSSPVAITSSADVNSDVFVSGNEDGFMAVWVNSSNDAFASFSANNGSSWSTPVQIATNLVVNNLAAGSGANVFVSSSSSGFVVAWIGQDTNAYASLSTDNGLTWSDPVAITTDGSVYYQNANDAFGYVSVAAQGDNYVFTWLDADNNIRASLSGTSSAPRSFSRPNNRRPGS